MLEQNSLVIAYPHGGELKTPMSNSVSAFIHYDSMHNRVYKATLSIRSPLVEDNRNVIARSFLEMKDTPKWLLFIDHDIEFAPDCPYMLLQEADEMEKMILSGLYFSQILKFSNDIVPLWFGSEDEDGYHIVEQLGGISGDPLQRIVNCGAGFLLIHRNVLEAFPLLDGDPWRWFGRDLYKLNGETIRLGEDMTFGRRAHQLGFSMWGHSGCTLEHIKETKLNMEAFLEDQKRITDRLRQQKNEDTSTLS